MKKMKVKSFAILIAMLAMFMPAALADAQPSTCTEACLKMWGVTGECRIPQQYNAGMTPLTYFGTLDCKSATCWCQKDPGLVCYDDCQKKYGNYTTGSCEQQTTLTPGTVSPGYGQVAQIYPNVDVSCSGTGTGFICVCRRANSEVASALAGLSAASVWPTIKECNYVGGSDVYQIRVAGTFAGGSGLRVEFPGTAVSGALPGSPAAGGGIPPAGIFGTGWFSEIRIIPASAVRRLTDYTIPIRFTVVPWPGQILQSTYTQSFSQNYPIDFGRMIPSNTFDDSVVCNVEELPTATTRAALTGPAEISISQITCTPAANAYENVWHLTDFDDNSTFTFGSGTTGQCRFSFEQTDVYGVKICAAAGSTLNVTKIATGSATQTINVPVTNCTMISFSELNISTPLRASTMIIDFAYSGTVALTRLEPFPDTLSVDMLNATPTLAVAGSEVTLVGTVTRRTFTAPGGRLVACDYQWKGGCYPCIGRDCKPSTTNPIGMPNWAFMMPVPGRVFENIESAIYEGKWDNESIAGTYSSQYSTQFNAQYGNVSYFGGLGVKLTPPSSTYAMDIALPPNTVDATTADRFWIRYTLRNSIGITVLDAVNFGLADWNDPDWSTVSSIALGLAAAGIATLQPLIALVTTAGTWLGAEKPVGIECKSGIIGMFECGMLGWAISNELNEKRCEPLQRDTQTNYTITTCRVPYILVPWWNLESVPEPDPDGTGPYALTSETCPVVTGLDKYLFNAGWWGAIDFLGDLVKTAQDKSLEKERNDLERRTAAMDTCSACVAGVPQGTALYTESERQQLIDKCKSTNFAGGNVSCYNNQTQTVLSEITGSQCHDNWIRITSASECDSKILKVSSFAPSKWCSRPFNFSDTFYHSRDGSVKWNGHSDQGGKCILRDSSCDTPSWGSGKEGKNSNDIWAATDEAGCRKLSPAEHVAYIARAHAVANLGCVACIKAKSQFCFELAVKQGTALLDYSKTTGSCKLDCGAEYQSIENPTQVAGPGKFAIKYEPLCVIYDEIDKQIKESIRSQTQTMVDRFTDLIRQTDVDAGRLNCQQCIAQNKIWCIIPDNIATRSELVSTCKIFVQSGNVACYVPSEKRVYDTSCEPSYGAGFEITSVAACDTITISGSNVCTSDETKCTGGGITIVRPNGNCNVANILSRMLSQASPERAKLWSDLNVLATDIDSLLTLFKAQNINESNPTYIRLKEIRTEIGNMQSELLAATALSSDRIIELTSTFNDLKTEFDSLKSSWKAIVGAGTIQGTVYNLVGNVMPGVTVIVTRNGVERKAPTDSNGKYNLSDLPPGDYVLNVKDQPTFSPVTATVERDKTSTIDLKAGDLRQRCEAKGGNLTQTCEAQYETSESSDWGGQACCMLKPVVLLSPANNSVVNASVAFTWSVNPKAANYRIQVSLSNDFTIMRVDSTIAQDSYTTTLQQPATYYWRVKACYSGDRCSAWSDARSFNIAAPPPPAQPLGLNPTSLLFIKGLNYNNTITGSGGTPPFTCTPPSANGITCSCNANICTIAGVPQTGGTFPFVIKDNSSPQKQGTFTLTVAGAMTASVSIEPLEESPIGNTNVRFNVYNIVSAAPLDNQQSYFSLYNCGSSDYECTSPSTVGKFNPLMPGANAMVADVWISSYSFYEAHFDVKNTYGQTLNVVWRFGHFVKAGDWNIRDIRLVRPTEFTPHPALTSYAVTGLTGSVTASQLSQLGEIPASTTGPSFGGIPVTGNLLQKVASYSPYDLLPDWAKGASTSGANDGINTNAEGANELVWTQESGAGITGMVGSVGVGGTTDEIISSEGRSAYSNAAAGSSNQPALPLPYYLSPSSYSSPGALSVTGEAIALGSGSATGLLNSYVSRATGGLQQTLWSIQSLQALREGQTAYTRQVVMQPGLSNLSRCAATDAAMPRHTTMEPMSVATTLVGTSVIQEPWPYFTKEGTITPSDAMLYVTIYNSTGGIVGGCLNVTANDNSGGSCEADISPPAECYVACSNVPIRANAGYETDGQFGRFRYSYTAPSAGQYRAVVRAGATDAVGTAKTMLFTVQNRTPPGISGIDEAVCGMPNDVMVLAPIITEPSIGAGSTYTVGVAVEAPAGGDTVNRAGWVPSRVGLISCLSNGTCSRASDVNVTLQPGQSMPLALESNVSADTKVRIVVRDATGMRAELSFLHRVVSRISPNFNSVGPGIASTSAVGQQYDYDFSLENNIVAGCQPTSWQIIKERPGSGWALWFTSTNEPLTTMLNVPAGTAVNMTMHVLPTAFDSIRTFPIYVLASEFAPMKIADTQAGTAAQHLASDGIVLWYSGADKKIRSVDASGNAGERGVAGEAVRGIAADWGNSGNIYWISSDKIWTSSKSSFTPSSIVSGLTTAARGLAVDATKLYWIEGDLLKSAPKTGTTNCASACTLLTDIGTAFGLTVDSVRIYWSDEADVWWVSKGVVAGMTSSAAASAGLAGRMWEGKSAVGLATGPAGSGLEGVWASLVPDPDSATGKIVQLRANATGDDVLGGYAGGVRINTVADRVYAIGQDFPKAVAVDSRWVYWIDRAGDVWRIARDNLAGYAMVQYQYTATPPSLRVTPAKAVAPAGTNVTYTLNLTNTASVPIDFRFERITALPSGWVATDIMPTNVSLGPNSGVLATTSLKSPVTAEGEFNFTVRVTVPKTHDLDMEIPLIYNITNHTWVGLTANNITSATASPGKTVWWALNVTNNDPAEFVKNGTVNLSIVAKPSDWTAGFCIGGTGSDEERIADCTKSPSVVLSISPASSDSSTLSYVQSPKWSEDGPQTLTVRASIDGLNTDINVTYRVFGCGNGICDPERGEYDETATGMPVCIDCEQGYSDFRCHFTNSGGNRTWYECDRTADNRTEFGVYLNRSIDIVGLTGLKLRACKRDASIDGCIASQCGIIRQDVNSPVAISGCIADLSKGANGTFGPLYTGSVACPADAEGEYYLLYMGTSVTTISGQAPSYAHLNWTSANFTFSCPAYGTETASRLLNDPVYGWTKKLEDCQRAYSGFAGEYGPGSVCAQMTLRACNLRRAHVENLTAVINSPTVLGANKTQAIIARTAAIEAQLDALAAQCIELPVLEITNITLPSTRVGEIEQMNVKVKNILNAQYRGYVACNLTLPDGSSRVDTSNCTLFAASANTTARVSVPLTQAGEWRVNECTVWAESAEFLPADRCMQAATRFSTLISNATFAVEPSDIRVNSPAYNELVSGNVSINATVSGYYDGIDWAVSAAEGCAGASWTALSKHGTAFTKSWTGSWNSTLVPDGEYWMCFQGRMAGSTTLLISSRVGTDNWEFTFNPGTESLQVRARTTARYDLTLQNIGTASDVYNISCTGVWITTFASLGRSAVCGGAAMQLVVGPNQTANINASTEIPVVASGTVGIINFTARGKYDTVQAVERITASDLANKAPNITNMTVSPSTVTPSGTITFHARVSDPDNDDIPLTQACADASCSTVFCNMTGSVERMCSILANLSTGTHDWWVKAQDDLNLSKIVKGGQFTVSTPQLNCTYSCMSSCESSNVSCMSRTDYGQRNCDAGFTCCRETPIPGCGGPENCTVHIKTDCIWVPTKNNYSINTVVEWSGTGTVSAIIASAGSFSAPIATRPALFSSSVLTAGVKPVSASVQNAVGGDVCANETTVICGSRNITIISPRPNALTIASASASSSQIGNEANKAIDRDGSTAWRPSASLPQWLKLDLGTSKTIEGVGIYSSSGRPLNFTISSSFNDITWKDVSNVRNASYSSSDWNVTIFNSSDAKYVLINITAAENDNPQIYEVDIYAGILPTLKQLGASCATDSECESGYCAANKCAVRPAEEFPLVPVAVTIVIVLAIIMILYSLRVRIRLWWSYIRG